MKEDYFDAECGKCFELFPTIWKTCEAPTSKECMLRDWAKCKACENQNEFCGDCLRCKVDSPTDDVIEQAFREGLEQGKKEYNELMTKLKELVTTHEKP